MIRDGDINCKDEDAEKSDVRHTTVIRISDINYEKLRTHAFHERKPIRQLADELLEGALREL